MTRINKPLGVVCRMRMEMEKMTEVLTETYGGGSLVVWRAQKVKAELEELAGATEKAYAHALMDRGRRRD